MPELPQVEALARSLTRVVSGRRIEDIQVSSISALKTFSPPVSALCGRTVGSVARRGKLLVISTEQGSSTAGVAASLNLVIHLARSGWVRWHEVMPIRRPALRGPVAMRLAFEGGGGVEITEQSSEKRLALYVVEELDDVPALARLGVDALDPTLDVGTLRARLASSTGHLKKVLTEQRVIGGIGNAYSDEVLHLARLSPFRPVSRLTEEEIERLHAALVEVLSDAARDAAESEPDELKRDKKARLRVHGRTGEPCPDCGEMIREVSFTHRSFQYCPRCQTGGRILADRRLSRLLK
ncbi:MAG TPA: DNA-formamidopyrimidine glycosylase family protein [Candidatus Sulfotelmatobacter sp.]|nr:DNA-formamidopyrimidine glycosylase family protein [Candidatus Sulfotelmatobacter sp.]